MYNNKLVIFCGIKASYEKYAKKIEIMIRGDEIDVKKLLIWDTKEDISIPEIIEAISKTKNGLIVLFADDDSEEILNKAISDSNLYALKAYEFFKEYDEVTVNRQIRVLQRILSATDNEVKSYDWMREQISLFGIFPYFHSIAENSTSEVNFSEKGLLQTLEEFTRFCIYISDIKVKKAIEIGVYYGRSSYFMCALLFRANPCLEYMMVDIHDELDSFSEFKKILPVVKCIPSTSSDYRGEDYDFVFIDGDHSFDASYSDWKNVGKNSNGIVVFHDIYGHEYDEKNGGIVRTWQEVLKDTKGKQHKVFSTFPNEWMGIGVVWMR